MPCPLHPYPYTCLPFRNARLKAFALLLVTTLGACAEIGLEPASRSSPHSYHSQQSPGEAARCFARNAEEHSSALVSKVTAQENRADVVVSVRNGVTYATAEFRRSGSGAVGTIDLKVVTSGSQRDLVVSLTEGC
jgi:hypothetical protein